MKGVISKIKRLFDDEIDDNVQDNCSFDEEPIEEMISGEEVTDDNLFEQIEITNNNIELLSKQIMKNSYVKSIENKIIEIEEEIKKQDDADSIYPKFDEVKKSFILGKENQKKLRNKVMSSQV